MRADLIHGANRTLSPLAVLVLGSAAGGHGSAERDECRKHALKGAHSCLSFHFTLLQPQLNESRMSRDELLQHVARLPLQAAAGGEHPRRWSCDGASKRRTFFFRRERGRRVTMSRHSGFFKMLKEVTEKLPEQSVLTEKNLPSSFRNSYSFF